MTFLDGHPLVSTLFNCAYLRPSALAEMVQSEKRGASKEVDACRFIWRAMLMATIKSTELVWDEIAKGQVYEVRPSLPRFCGSPGLTRPRTPTARRRAYFDRFGIVRRAPFRMLSSRAAVHPPISDLGLLGFPQ